MRFRIAAVFVFTCLAGTATVVPRLSLERLVDQSSYIVQGRITGKRVAWDSGHHYIWTHYQIEIADVLKSSGPAVLEVSVPGGILDGVGMRVEGVVGFSMDEEVLLFLYRTPIGYYRTTGYGQGKYSVVTDPATGDRRLRGHLAGMTLADPAGKQGSRRETSLTALEGYSLDQFKARIRALVAGGK